MHLTEAEIFDITREKPPSEASTSFMGNFLNLNRPKYTKEAYHNALVDAVVMHDLPFRYVEWEGIRAIHKVLRPEVQNDFISRTTLVRRLWDRFEVLYAQQKTRLNRVTSRISLAVDAWSSVKMDSFLGITAHYVDDNWKLQSTLLEFRMIEGCHSGKNLAEHLLNSLQDFGLTRKLLCITLDNAANNNTMIKWLEQKLVWETHSFQGSWQHIR